MCAQIIVVACDWKITQGLELFTAVNMQCEVLSDDKWDYVKNPHDAGQHQVNYADLRGGF